MDTIYDKLTAIADSIREKTGKAGSLTLDDMAYEISTIKSDADLNFDIVAYETEEALLAATPAENTIGVISDTEISKWSFDSNEPDNPVDNMLWMKIGTESQVEFNVIKNADIPIYPISAKQYIGDAWVDVVAMTYQGGEWVAWTANLLSLYPWKPIGLMFGSNGTALAPTATKNPDDSVILVMPGSGTQQRGGYIIDELIDLTFATKLKVKYNNMTYKTYAEFQPSILPNNYDNQDDKIAYTIFNTDGSFPASGEIIVDVSTLNGFYYIFLATYATKSGSLSITVTEVTLE